MRDRRLELFGLAALALAGGLVWLTRNPGAPIVRRAERWPLVGPAATAFRARWDPPPPPPAPPAAAPVVEYHYLLESDGPTPGRPAAPRREGRPPGQPPAAGATTTPAAAAAGGVAPVLPVLALPADPGLLARAARQLGAGADDHRLGGYRLLTDTADAARIARWRAIAESAESAWTSRYGVAPIGVPAETIVLFARQAALRELQGVEPRLGALDANGFTLDGLVALAVEGLSEAELDATLQHELAHLLTRRSLGPALPAWLAEGLAEEFGLAPLAAGGRFDFTGVRGALTRDGNRYELRGGLAALDRLRRRAERDELLSLAELAAVSELDFSAGEAGIERYAAAFAWVRFLLAESARAERFRAFLASVAKGEEPTLARLERTLGTSLDALGGPLRAWLVPECERILRAAGVPRQRGEQPLREVPPSELPSDPTRRRS